MRNIIFLGVLIIGTSLLSSCNTSTMVFGNGKSWIPEHFDPKKTILLVEGFPKSLKQDQKMRDYMSEKYPYKYEFASTEKLKTKRESMQIPKFISMH